MKVLNKLLEVLKNIIFIPRNLAIVSKQSNNLKDLESKLETLNQKLNDLDFDSISKKLDTLSQNHENSNNFKDSSNYQIGELATKIQEGFENQFLQFESLLSIYNSLPNLKFLPGTRGWAGSPDFLAKIVELILKEKPRFVLEASSGVSSVIIGLALKLNNYGKSISLDHDRYYSKITGENMALNELEMVSTVKYCPLTEYNNHEQIWKWYDINDINFPNKIDMLIVDGPPRLTQELARYPAIPILHEHFADRFLIILDDSKRDDEAIIIKMWAIYLEGNNYKVKIENFENFEKGMTILQVYRT